MTASAWRVGDRVRVRGQRWTIRAVTHAADCSALELHGDEPSPSGERPHLTVLLPFDRPLALGRRRAPRAVRPRRWLHVVDRILLDVHPLTGFATLAESSIRLLPYQLAPALSVLEGATRLLVADEVGLGKTIQAGILLRELSSRTDSFRALILTPAGLRHQWAAELQAHFGLDAAAADAAWLRERTSELPRDVNPWSLPGIYIASHDFVKRPEALRPLDDLAWHVLVVDEAHLVAAGSDRRTAIHALASRSLRVVLLTATPHSGDPGAFAALCAIGRLTGDEPPMQVFARSKSDVGAGVVRRSRVLAITPSPAEHEMHRLLDAYCAAVWKEAAKRGDEGARLASIVLRKRALSSPTSLALSVARRRTLLEAITSPPAQQLLLPLAEEDPLDDLEPDAVLGAKGLDDAGRESRWLAAILDAARVAARDESKLHALLRLLRRVREPVIVFTEYRDTLAHLERRLASSGRAIAVLHGGMTPAERARIPDLLGTGADVLLATDAAAEGLNLHHRCRVVVHFELPWNAARLEQRAGRVDRLGQSRRPHDVALISSSTAERLVLAPLVARARASRTGYRMLEHLGESKVADAILGGIALPVADDGAPRAPELPAPVRLASDPVREADRLGDLRARLARSRSSPGPQDGPVVTAIRSPHCSGAAAWLVLVYVLSLESDHGRPLHSEPFAIAVRSPARGWRSPAAVRAALDRSLMLSQASVAAVIRERSADVHRTVGAMYALAFQQAAVRRAAITRAARPAARRVLQPQLFRRRVDLRNEADTTMELFTEEAEPASIRVESGLAAAIFLDRPDAWPPTEPGVMG